MIPSNCDDSELVKVLRVLSLTPCDQGARALGWGIRFREAVLVCRIRQCTELELLTMNLRSTAEIIECGKEIKHLCLYHIPNFWIDNKTVFIYFMSILSYLKCSG